MFGKQNALTLLVVAVIVGLAMCLATYLGGAAWSTFAGTTKAGLILVYVTIVTLVTMGVVGLMEADNEVNPTDKKGLSIHYVKLVGSLFLIGAAAMLFVLVLIPLTFHGTVQGLVPIYAVKPFGTPLVQLKDDMMVPDPAHPGKTVEFKYEKANFQALVIDGSSLIDNDGNALTGGTIRVTLVLEQDDAVKNGIIVPQKRVKGKGEVWYQSQNKSDGSKGAQSWVAPF